MKDKQISIFSNEDENAHLKKRVEQLEKEVESLKNGNNQRQINLLTHIINNVPLAILSLDKEGNMQFANTSFIKLFDVDEAVFSSKTNINNFSSFKDTELLKKIINLLTNQLQFDHEITMGDLGNAESKFRSRGIAIRSNSGDVISYILIIGDITKRKIAEKNLIAAKEKAEESNMLKTAFLSNLSHEIRTPLNHILGFLELLFIDGTTAEERAEYSTIIRGSSEVLLKRIDDIIDISKIETGQMVINEGNVDIINILEEFYEDCKVLKSKYEKDDVDLVLNRNHDYTKVIIKTDPIKLRQILYNFVDNAFIFTHKGSVEIGFSINDKNGICLYVKDTGVGIDEEYHSTIFEHFRQVDNTSTRKVGGSGLGLAISRGLSHLLQGNISMKSKVGEGSVFYLKIPESIISLNTKPNNFVDDTKYEWDNITMLVAEYEEIDFNIINIMLSNTGLIIHRAKTGDEAIKIYHDKNPDIVLLDYNLPIISGIEFTKILKSKNSMVPIITLVDLMDSNDNANAVSAGSDCVIGKPLQKEILLNTINDLIINSWF